MKFLSAVSIFLSDISLESLLFSIGNIDQLSGEVIAEDTISIGFSFGINTLIAISLADSNVHFSKNQHVQIFMITRAREIFNPYFWPP